jgi:hypothetical protein
VDTASRPLLSQQADQLARNNARTLQATDRLIEAVDQILKAMAEGNWTELRASCESLAMSAESRGWTEVQAATADVQQALDGAGDEQRIRRSVIRLIARCGRAK